MIHTRENTKSGAILELKDHAVVVELLDLRVLGGDGDDC